MTVRDEAGFELFEFDPASGRSVWRYFDGEKTVFRTDYPVSETLHQNAEARAAAAVGWKGDWHRIASVPLNIVYASGLAEAVNQQDDRFISRFLNDGDNRAWRTKEGSV